MPSPFQSNAIFWVEADKIKPNPHQPRRQFDEDRLNDLAESIRQYGILQPLVVTRREVHKPDGGLAVEYELISGERRLRASKIAGVNQVPVIIHTAAESERTKLELAIIENLQREDLNPVERAGAFKRLSGEFGFTHADIAKKVGKSRIYVTNSIRILALPEEMKRAVIERRITEGHTRPLLMLSDRPQEQAVLFKEIIYKQMNVRDAELAARQIAVERARKKSIDLTPEALDLQKRLSEMLGTKVQIERREYGGKIVIDFFSDEDLQNILKLIHSNKMRDPNEFFKAFLNREEGTTLTPQKEGQSVSEIKNKDSLAENQPSDMNVGISKDAIPRPIERSSQESALANSPEVEQALGSDLEENSARVAEHPDADLSGEQVRPEANLEDMLSDVETPELVKAPELTEINSPDSKLSEETPERTADFPAEPAFAYEQARVEIPSPGDEENEDLYSIKNFTI